MDYYRPPLKLRISNGGNHLNMCLNNKNFMVRYLTAQKLCNIVDRVMS